MRALHRIPLLVALAASLAVAGSDPRDAPVDAANLLSSERFWPYQVARSKDGSVGVLIRVEPDGVARLDFGRDGLREVPVSETDLLERANRVRRGELAKQGANFVLAIGPRLADSSGPVLRAYPLETAAAKSRFLCVFADPSSPGFAEIAKSLASIGERQGVTTILFPQGRVSDLALREQLRALGWTVPFVFDHLSDAYTRTLLPASLQTPAILLVTNEGRAVLSAAWREDLGPDLESALDATFGG